MTTEDSSDLASWRLPSGAPAVPFQRVPLETSQVAGPISVLAMVLQSTLATDGHVKRRQGEAEEDRKRRRRLLWGLDRLKQLYIYNIYI